VSECVGFNVPLDTIIMLAGVVEIFAPGYISYDCKIPAKTDKKPNLNF